MTQNERLRALLAEARETLRDFAENWDCDSDAHKHGTTCRVCESREAQQRIEAALAEPGDVHPSSLTDVVTLLENERDEARAEIERLKSDSSWGALRRLDDAWRAESSAAYRRGAEAMREAAVREIDCTFNDCDCRGDMHAKTIRDLPIPEDKP